MTKKHRPHVTHVTAALKSLNSNKGVASNNTVPATPIGCARKLRGYLSASYWSRTQATRADIRHDDLRKRSNLVSGEKMNARRLIQIAMLTALAIPLVLVGIASATDSIKGQVLGGGAPIGQSTVTLWAATADAPKQLSQTKTDNEGRFEISSIGAPADSSLYLVAMGGEPKSSCRQQSGYRTVNSCW